LKKILLTILILAQNNSFALYTLFAARSMRLQRKIKEPQRNFSDLMNYDEIMKKCNATRIIIFKMSKIEEKGLKNVGESVAKAKAKAAFDDKEYKKAMQICANGNFFYCGIDDIHSPQCWCNKEIQKSLDELSTSLSSLKRCQNSLTTLRAQDLADSDLRHEFMEAHYKK